MLRRALARCVDANTPTSVRRFINDYRRCVEFLELRDRMALRGTFDDDPRIQRWASATNERRWIDKRLSREVVRMLEALGRPGATTWDDAVGSAVDLNLGPEHRRLGATNLYAKWRVGKGFGLHMSFPGNEDAARGALRGARLVLRPVLEPTLTPFGFALSRSSGVGKGKSGEIVGLRDQTRDVHVITSRIVEWTDAVLGGLPTPSDLGPLPPS